MKKLRCRRCKQIFEYGNVLGQLCPNCMAYEEANYQAVRLYIKDNPGISITDVSKETGVSTSKILSYIKEERLEIVATANSFLKCKNCNAHIHTGIFCENCKRNLPVTPMGTDNMKTYRNNYKNRKINDKEQKTDVSTLRNFRKQKPDEE
ncbi:MAG: winged helix-turn-helix domain-containing protein [Lachnospirales bacterium]